MYCYSEKMYTHKTILHRAFHWIKRYTLPLKLAQLCTAQQNAAAPLTGWRGSKTHACSFPNRGTNVFWLVHKILSANFTILQFVFFTNTLWTFRHFIYIFQSSCGFQASLQSPQTAVGVTLRCAYREQTDAWVYRVFSFVQTIFVLVTKNCYCIVIVIVLLSKYYILHTTITAADIFAPCGVTPEVRLLAPAKHRHRRRCCNTGTGTGENCSTGASLVMT